VRLALICFAVGVALLQQQAELLPVWVYLTCPMFLSLLLVLSSQLELASKIKQKLQLRLQLRLGVQTLFAMLLGFCWAGLYAHFYLSEQLPSAQ